MAASIAQGLHMTLDERDHLSISRGIALRASPTSTPVTASPIASIVPETS